METTSKFINKGKQSPTQTAIYLCFHVPGCQSKQLEELAKTYNLQHFFLGYQTAKTTTEQTTNNHRNRNLRSSIFKAMCNLQNRQNTIKKQDHLE